MEEQVLLSSMDAGIATLTLNRPQALNALSRALRRALTDAFLSLARNPDVGVIVLTGAGRAFCAGLDLKELAQQPREDTEQAVSGTDLVAAMEQCPQPIIGAINGFAITGGFELALACDILIASSEAKFADTHARVGIMPGWGLSQKLSRLIGIYRAKELSLTGNFLDARTAEAWGLVNRVVTPEELLPTCYALARDILSCDPVLVRQYKRLMDDGFALPYAEGRALESQRAREHAASLSPEELARRRLAVQQRGRQQASSE